MAVKADGSFGEVNNKAVLTVLQFLSYRSLSRYIYIFRLKSGLLTLPLDKCEICEAGGQAVFRQLAPYLKEEDGGSC